MYNDVWEGAPTGILPSFISVDKTGNQHNECEKSDSTHQSNKPALGRDPSMDACQPWGKQYSMTLTWLGLFKDSWLNVYIDKSKPMQRQRWGSTGTCCNGNVPKLILNSLSACLINQLKKLFKCNSSQQVNRENQILLTLRGPCMVPWASFKDNLVSAYY